jgi:hypothetical protein
VHFADEFVQNNHGRVFLVNGDGKSIVDYIQQRRDDHVKARERERDTGKVHARCEQRVEHDRHVQHLQTPIGKKKARTDTMVRVRPAVLQSVPGSNENTNHSDDNQCATILCVPVSRKKKDAH